MYSGPVDRRIYSGGGSVVTRIATSSHPFLPDSTLANARGPKVPSQNKTDIWMPLYWGDYLRDTGHLSALEHGAYLLLLGHYWTSRSPLPNDSTLLARIARVTPRQWRVVGPLVLPFFAEDGDILRHKRVDAELEKSTQRIEQRRNAGRASAATRAQRPFNDRSTDVPTGGATKQALRARASPSPSPSPSPIGSDPDGSGEPHVSPPEDLLEIPLSLRKPLDGDYGKLLFSSGLDWLASVLEKPPKACRSILGTFLQLSGQDHEAVWGLLVEAEREGVAEPVAWITRALKPKPGPASLLREAMG